MGVMTICMTTLLFGIYFPMWGGMFFPARKNVTEEDYYLAEYTPAEISQVCVLWYQHLRVA
jgi:NNP family nitrate/nitrite transporter-like MFS transporter